MINWTVLVRYLWVWLLSDRMNSVRFTKGHKALGKIIPAGTLKTWTERERIVQNKRRSLVPRRQAEKCVGLQTCTAFLEKGRINICCLDSLGFGVICYSAVDNWDKWKVQCCIWNTCPTHNLGIEIREVHRHPLSKVREDKYYKRGSQEVLHQLLERVSKSEHICP